MTDPYIKGWNRALESVRGAVMFIADENPDGELQEVIDYIDGAGLEEASE